MSGDIRLRAERLEPFDFDQHAKADQAEFAEVSAQRIDLAVVASVQRGEGGEFGECGHGHLESQAKPKGSILRESGLSCCSMIARQANRRRR